MVDTGKLEEYRILLEEFLIQMNQFRLDGTHYDLMMLEPSTISDKFSLIISSKKLDFKRTSTITNEILEFIKEHSKSIYDSIVRLNVIPSSHPFVRNVNSFFAHEQTHNIDLRDFRIGGLTVEKAYLVKKNILKRLTENSAVHLTLANGEIIPAGIMKIDSHFKVYYYTGKGLREIFSTGTQSSEQDKERANFLARQPMDYLIKNEHVSTVFYSQIIGIS